MDGHWAKSSHSNFNANCVEWQKSSYSFSNGNCLEWRSACQTGECVEIAAPAAPAVLVRDSKLATDSPILKFTPAAWMRFVNDLKRPV